MTKYNADDIIINAHPKIIRLPNGKRTETWEVVLKQAIDREIDLTKVSEQLSYEGFEVQIILKTNKHLNINLITLENPNPYGHDYTAIGVDRMMEDIEQIFGSIDTIQGQKMEERWSLFRNSRKRNN